MANSWIGNTARHAIYTRDELTCCYCGKKCITGIADASKLEAHDRKNIATLDHIVPQKELAESATNDADFLQKRRDPKNLVVVCVGCNSSKQHTPLYVWCARTKKDYAVIIAEIARRIAMS